LKKIWKNTALATILSTTLAACGGGGGGPGVPVVFDPPTVTNIAFNSAINGELVSDFISVVHDLSQDEWLDVKDAVEIFNWVESNKTKFANNELENYKITVDGQEMSLQKGFNMILGFKKKYYDGKETFWQNTADTGKLDDENEYFLALKDIAEEDLAKTKEDYYNELESTGTATLVETVEETTPIYKFGAITEQDPITTYSEWQVQETNAIAPDVSSETTTETDNAGDVYEVVTTTTTPITEHISVRDKTVSVSSTQLKKTYNEITTWYIYSNGAKTKDIKQVFVSEESVAYGSPKVTITTETKSETVAGESDIKVKKTLKIKNISFDTGINAQMVSDFISVVHDLSQDEVVDVEKALEIFNWVKTNELKFNNNELENYKITIDGQEMSLQKGFNILLGFKKKYYDGKETFWQNTADTGKLDDENYHYLALKDIAEEDLAKTKEDYYNELESTGTASIDKIVKETTPIYEFGAVTDLDPVITYSEWQVQETNAIAPDVSSEITTETTDTGAVYEVVTTTTTPLTERTLTRNKIVSVSSTQLKKTYNQITTWSIYTNGAKTKDIKQVFVSEESVAYGSPKVTTTPETDTDIVKGEPIIKSKKTLVENPIINTTVTESKESSMGDPIAGDPVITYSDWTIVNTESSDASINIEETRETTESGAVYKVVTETKTLTEIKSYSRDKITTTPYTQIKTTTTTTRTITDYADGSQDTDTDENTTTQTLTLDPDINTVSESKQETVELDPITTVTKTLITNPIIEIVELEPTVSVVETVGEEYTETTSVLGDATSTYTEEGSATTATTYTYSTDTVDNGDGTSTKTTTKYTVTTVTLPVTTYTTKVRTYTDKVYKDIITTTTTTPRTQRTYADGSTDIVLGTATQSQSTVKTFVGESQRSVSEIVDSSVANTVTTATDDGVVHLVETIDAGYTDDDPNLGTRTVGYSTDKTTYETDEYHENSNGFAGGSAKQVNASSAYSRGWTGKGSIVAVADTGYDTDHAEFDGQVLDTKDYYGNGIQDNHGHGSHVLGTILAKKDGTGMHGVAYDAKAVVIKIGDQRSVSLDDAASGFSWAADQGAIVGNLSANSNYDSGFRNSITKIADDTYKTTSPYYDYENGTYYNNMTPDTWKASTDKGLVLVNSAGNQGLDISAMPGWFATETDADGNLVLGGKVLIVGSYNFNTNSMDSWSNKAGHLCRVIVDNACRDTYKTSDFYVLAPGNTYSTNNEGSYDNMTGTSMAAPIVTGQVAVLHQMWPHMKGENLVKLVTTTADKTFTGYDVHIHGQGIVDFDEATKPQGSIGIPTTGRVDGSTSSISSTYVSGSGSMQAVLSNLQIMVLDDFDRDYYMNLGDSFTVQDNRKYSDVSMLVDNKNTFLPHQQMYGSFAQGGQYDLAKNYNFGFYTGENGGGDYSLNVGKDFYLNDKFKLKTSVGYMSEQDTWLGNASEGVLAVGDNNDTRSANIGVAYQLGNNVLSLDYSKGKTDINTEDGSLIKSFSDIETESYRLAYEIHKDKHTTFGWSFSLPSHITSGSMDLEVAESVNLDGTINYTDINSDLTQSTKEKNIGFYYNKSGENELDTSFNFTAEYRTDKSGVANNDGVEMAVKMTKKFWGSCKFLWMKNPKCFDKDGNMKSNLFGTSIDNATKHGLVYNLEKDMFVPIKK
jgi:subtilisin family serine protease